MEKKIIVKNIEKQLNKILINFETQGNIDRFFNSDTFTIEFNINIESVPSSILIIPFMCNIIPIAFILNIDIYIEELDEDFLRSIDAIREGYKKMYPNIEFKGRVCVKNKITNILKNNNKNSMMLFSGGVDAFSTFYNHIEENPILATICGADILLDDIESWKVVKEHTRKIAEAYSLENILIETNFKEFINQDNINNVIYEDTKDNWWHGFQHGIGMIGLLAPIAYIKGTNTIYIASSHTVNEDAKCASNPYIDEALKFCGCSIIHDQYDVSRQQKVNRIVEITKAIKSKPVLRVCWQFNSGGNNCCKCEKCYRTIFELLAANADPNEYGFRFNKHVANRIKFDMKYKIFLSDGIMFFWKDIQKEFKEKRKDLKNVKSYKWIYKINFDKFNKKIIKRIIRRLRRR